MLKFLMYLWTKRQENNGKNEGYNNKDFGMKNLITKVYQKWSWYRTEVRSGWYYKIGKKEYGIYKTEREANASLLLRIKDYS